RGIPATIKDNISTIGFKTTCASKFLEKFEPVFDATVIKRLRAAGATILGKTNLDEFAMGSSTENSGFFTTRNPRDPERVPGGSSGGSAAAVAANEAIFALGSDTGGSIRQPAALCGVVGLKPTYGRVSRFGLVAFASSLDQIGPLTKDVHDCALVLNLIDGHDAHDSTSVNQSALDYSKDLSLGVNRLKLGLPKEYVKALRGEALRCVETWVKTFKDMGVETLDVSLPHTDYAIPVYYILASSEASANLARFDGVRYSQRASDENVETMFSESRDKGFGAEVKRRIMIGTYALSSGYYDAYYTKAQKVRGLIKQDFDRAFQQVDAIIGPTSPTPAFKIGEKSDDPIAMYLSDVYTVPINLAGIPSISIPGGIVDGLPFGLQIIGDQFQESKILRVAYAYEQASN
ncbi:Asp-tRNA(Asn)/Glu-tRNA(Gln) amidotransferase subunit GatA, partial [Candidatus Acetothermia bacterium]|nr:Asp-tRNA(Asn)/Glu-tRNA(Gln) amidotransferase subunit GatA [Candidatus Acetothermia bacterium]